MSIPDIERGLVPPKTPNLDSTYVYIDETIFKDKYIGVCVLETSLPIENGVIISAINDLRNDPDIIGNKNDDLTIKRGYFHASEDSKNAHSHLARNIKSHISGIMHYSYMNFENDKVKEKDFRLNTIHSVMMKLKSTKRIVIHFEKRQGFSMEVFESQIEILYNYLDKMAYEMPFFPTFYPQIEIIANDKTEPGIQVADYLLWALNWALYETGSKNARWLGWAGATSSTRSDIPAEISERGGKFGWYMFNQWLPSNALISVETYPLDIRMESLSTDETLSYYVEAERRMHSLVREVLPPHASHFAVPLLNLVRDLKNSSISEIKKVKGVASMFLRLFDTLPLYANMDKSDAHFAELMRIRKHMGLLFHGNLLHAGRTLDAYCQLRHHLFNVDSAQLGFAQ